MSEPIRTWEHSRKGRIRGRILAQHGEWLHIELTEDHNLRMHADGHRQRGEVVVVRASFMREATP